MTAPILRFKDQGRSYPDWVEKKIKDCVTFSKGGSLSKSDLSPHGATPCLLYGELYTTYGEVTKAVINKTDSTEDLVKSQMNDVILPMSGETAEDIAKATCIKQEGVAYGGDLMVLRSKSLDGCFLSYSLNSVNRRQISRIAQGKTVVHINPSRVSDISINIACLEEQQKIAAFFTALDEKIDLVEKELSLTEKISSVVFEQIYRGDLQLNKLDGSPFPVWQIRKLDQLLDFQNGINASKEQFGSGIKLISVKEVLSKTPVTYDSIESSINVDEKLAKRFSVEYGDVIFQRSSETAEEAGSANVYLDSRPSVFGGFVIRGKQKADYHPQFMKMALRSPKVRRQIVRLAQGAQHVNIGQEQLSSVEIKFPCLEEQKKIAELISDFEHKELVLVQKLDALKRLKQAFMQQMFI